MRIITKNTINTTMEMAKNKIYFDISFEFGFDLFKLDIYVIIISLVS
jgi:hypothetical protein